MPHNCDHARAATLTQQVSDDAALSAEHATPWAEEICEIFIATTKKTYFDLAGGLYTLQDTPHGLHEVRRCARNWRWQLTLYSPGPYNPHPISAPPLIFMCHEVFDISE